MSRDEQARALIRPIVTSIHKAYGMYGYDRHRVETAVNAIIEALRGASGGGADGLRAIEAARKEWFCSGADCTEYDHGRDEGFELAIAAYRKAAPAAPPPPGPADQPAENAKSSDEE